MNQLWETLLAALALGVPLIIAAGVGVVLQWLRVRRARLRAERMRLPPSTEPPEPSVPWYSLRPKRSKGRKDELR